MTSVFRRDPHAGVVLPDVSSAPQTARGDDDQLKFPSTQQQSFSNNVQYQDFTSQAARSLLTSPAFDKIIRVRGLAPIIYRSSLYVLSLIRGRH